MESLVEAELVSLCRQWLVEVTSLITSEQQHEALPAAPGTFHGRRSAIVSTCQQLHHAELHAAVDAFLAFSQRTAWHTTPGSVSPTAYLMVVDSQLLQLTSDALCFLRASRLQQACEVSPLEAALLAACAVMVSAVHSQAAPLDTWRPLLEQLLAPQTCGFLLLLADALAVLTPLDPAQGALVAAEGAAPQGQPAAPTGHAEAASSPPGRQATTAREASSRLARSGLGPPSSTAAQLPQLPLTGGPSSQPAGPSSAPRAQGCSAYVERVAAAAYTGVAQQATALLAADRPPGPQGAGAAAQPVLSRPVVLCALRLVRDLASACTREASLRWAGRPQGGRGRSAGLPDLTHLLAVLTALLRELDLLQHLVDLHRAAEEAGAAPAALEPLLETVVAAAACFSRPGQPPTLPAARSSNCKGPHSPGAAALPGPVLKFLVDELALVAASVTNEVALYAGLPYPQLPHSLQGSLKVLHHLVRSVVVFGAVSSPQRRSLSPEAARRPAAPPGPPAAVGPLLAAAAAASQPGPLLAPRVAVQAGSGQGSRPGSARPRPLSAASQLRSAVLQQVVPDLVAAVRVFLSFAGSDVVYFCSVFPACLLSLKMVVRRLAYEGQFDLVLVLTQLLCEALAAMSDAMSRAAATAHRADLAAAAALMQQRQAEVTEGEGEGAAGRPPALAPDSGPQVVEREPVSALLPPSRRHRNRPHGWGAGALLTGLPQLASGPSPSSAPASPPSPLTPSTPRSPRYPDLALPASLSPAAAAAPSPRGQTGALLLPSRATLLGQAQAQRRANSPRPLSPAQPHKQPDNGLSPASPPHTSPSLLPSKADWPDLATAFISGYEQVLYDVLRCVKHLVRGFLLPRAWGTPSPPGCGPGAVLPDPHSPGPPHSALDPCQSLASCLFQPGAAQPVTDQQLLEPIPLRVTQLWQSLVAAGLLAGLEALFSLDLSSDILYFSSLAAVDVRLGGGSERAAGSTPRVDRVRLQAVKLARDCLSQVPQLAADRTGAYLLRALRKFLNRHCLPSSAADRPAGSAPHPSPGSAPHSPDAAPRPARTRFFTAFALASLSAIATELLPLPRLAAARAVVDSEYSAGRVWGPSLTKSRGAGLALLHCWMPLTQLLRALLAASTATKDSRPRAALLPSNQGSEEGEPEEDVVANRVMAVGPLHAVFEAWLQQLYQLAVRFSRLEVLQSALEVALLHGQALELMTAVLEGGHYSLAPRVQPQQPPVALQPSSASLALQPSRQHSADLSAPRGVRPQALDRDYGLSGLALLSFEELACLLHELARPPLATRMVTCGLAAALVRAAAATLQPGPGSPLISRPAGGPGRLAGAAAAPPASSSPPQLSGPGPLPPTHQAAGSGRGGTAGSAAPPGPCPAGASAADSFSPPAQLPRAPLWLLLVSSTLRRCACSLALTVAGLAETRLSATSGAATVDRYGLPSPHLLGSVLETRGVGRGFKLAAQEPLADEEGGAPAPSPPPPPAPGAVCGLQQAEWGGLTALALVQPILLLKAVKLLRITCKQWPGTGSELLRALAALPELLDPCTQLRPLFTELQPMAPEACQRARVAGQGSAALTMAVLDRKQWHATSSLPDLLPQPQRVTPSPQCEVQGRGAQPPQLARATAASWRSPSPPGSGEEQVGAGRVAGPDLPATGPAQAGSCGAVPSSISCVWEAHASCLVAASPRDPSWLEAARLVQQRHQVQVALAALQGAVQHVRELPPPEVVGATPGLSDSLHLLGCCNARCHNRLPGLPERSVGLRKCATCKRVAYCSEQCRAEAAQDVHDLFCHWWAAMAGE